MTDQIQLDGISFYSKIKKIVDTWNSVSQLQNPKNSHIYNIFVGSRVQKWRFRWNPFSNGQNF
jgi:hypothetical protein